MMMMRYFLMHVLIAAACGVAAVPAASAEDYFTELEIDQIRETQDIGRRTELFLRIAEIRLARLGLMESEEEIAPTEEGGNGVTRAIIKVLNPEAARELERRAEERPDFDNDLSAFSRAELLRGYYQALDEAMNNIDDAYERQRGDVRGPLEALKEFTENTLPLLEDFVPENEGEKIALADAISVAELAEEGAEQALDTVPRTERQ